MDSNQTPEQPFSEYFEYHLTHRVDPSLRDQFLNSQGQLQRMAMSYQGYISEDAPTLVHKGDDILIFKTSLRFNNAENCLKWLESKERRDLLQVEEVKGYQFEGNVNAEGYARWLSRSHTKPSPLWKINLLVLLVLYPTVMIFTLLVKRPTYIDFPTWMLFGNFCSVAITGWIAVPWVSQIYQQWLEDKGTKKGQMIALLTIVLILLGTVELFRRFPVDIWR
jgi:uncharacterized protein